MISEQTLGLGLEMKMIGQYNRNWNALINIKVTGSSNFPKVCMQ